MSEFEKILWGSNPKLYKNAIDFNSTVDAGRKEGWIVALKCVVNKLKTDNNILSSDNLVAWINQELKELEND